MKNLLKGSVLLLLLTGCSSAPTPIDEDPVVSEIQTSENHYADDFLSFDYPSDVKLFQTIIGEGAWTETLTFLTWNEEDQVYTHAGPKLNLSSYGKNGTPEEQFLEDQKTAVEHGATDLVTLDFGTTKAFKYTYINDFSGNTYVELELLIPNPRYSETDGYFGPYLLGTFSCGDFTCDSGYQEILDMFESTVRFE